MKYDPTGFFAINFLSHLNTDFSYAKICQWTQEQYKQYSLLLSEFERCNGKNSNVSMADKGKSLEILVTFLLNNCGNIFKVYQNIHSCTNEIDNLMQLTPAGRYLSSNGLLPQYYCNFISECKNYHGRVGVTYVGKFCSLMMATACKLGVLFSYHGVTGNKWEAGSGLIKKFYLHKENIDERYCLIDFEINDFHAILKGENFLQIVENKISALQFDTEYKSMLTPHPAESNL